MRVKKIFKSLFIIIICYSLVPFAAVVSDNDGSAFVTKAEFDALKENFKEQIENYNDSIDEKIDGAIAAYLAGIRLSNVDNLTHVYYDYKVNGENILWYGHTENANQHMNTAFYLPNNIRLNVKVWRYWTEKSTDTRPWYGYRNYIGTGYWVNGTGASGSATGIGANTASEKSYQPYLVCDTNDNILYKGTCAQNVYMTAMNWNDNFAADMISPITNFDKWGGQDYWTNTAARWVLTRCQTEITSKATLALCPMSTTKYNRVNYGANTWVYFKSRVDSATGTRGMLSWTMSNHSENYTGTESPPLLHNIQRIYLPEGRPLNSVGESDKKAINEYAYADIIKVSSYNGAAKYGVYLTTTTKDSEITFNVNVDRAGTIYIRTAANHGNASASTQVKSQSVNVGANKIVIPEVKKDTNLFIVYAPSGTNVGKITALTIFAKDID